MHSHQAKHSTDRKCDNRVEQKKNEWKTFQIAHIILKHCINAAINLHSQQQ